MDTAEIQQDSFILKTKPILVIQISKDAAQFKLDASKGKKVYFIIYDNTCDVAPAMIILSKAGSPNKVYFRVNMPIFVLVIQMLIARRV